MTQPWTPPTGNTWTDVTLQKRIGNPGGALTFEQNDQNESDTENPINWLGRKVMELLDSQWQTGEMKLSYTSTVPTGWLLVNNTTIGNASSNATYASADYLNLYTVLWTSASNDDLLTSAGGATTKGISAVSDWGAGKRLYLPDISGRAISGAGVSRSGITSRSVNAKYGAETISYTPTGAVSQASIAGITATCGAISTSGITATVSQATATSSAPSVSGITATSSAISIGSLTSSVTLDNGAISGGGSINVDGIVCALFNDNEKTTQAITCTTLQVEATAIAAALNTNVTVSSATIGGSIPTPTITIGGSIAAPTITVGSQTVTVGGTISSPSITIGGSIATQTFTGGSATLATLSPSIAMYIFIKY